MATVSFLPLPVRAPNFCLFAPKCKTARDQAFPQDYHIPACCFTPTSWPSASQELSPNIWAEEGIIPPGGALSDRRLPPTSISVAISQITGLGLTLRRAHSNHCQYEPVTASKVSGNCASLSSLSPASQEAEQPQQPGGTSQERDAETLTPQPHHLCCTLAT